MLFDTVRGATKELYAAYTSAEATEAESLKSFDADGVTLGNTWPNATNNDTWVAWNWKESASAAIEATRAAFPGGEIFAHLDKKSFRGWQRSSLVNFLEENEVPVLRGRDLSEE